MGLLREWSGNIKEEGIEIDLLYFCNQLLGGVQCDGRAYPQALLTAERWTTVLSTILQSTVIGTQYRGRGERRHRCEEWSV